MNQKSCSTARPNPGQFPKGRSGNPKGRPPASRLLKEGSALDIVLEKTLTVAHRGGTRVLTMEEALQQRTIKDALAGKRMAQREVLKWIEKNEAWKAKHAPKESQPRIERLISPDPDNADAALLLLGIAALNPWRADNGLKRAQLLLEPWSVQAALSRRRGGSRLTNRQLDWARHRTRDSDSLQWPQGTDDDL